jgi:ATP-dependent exoDNAse (exonuclease V) beta subunit
LSEATELVNRFISSPRFAAIQSARQKHVELEFMLAWPPDGEVSEDSPYLQGFIDCLYQPADGAGWRIVDYKTNQLVPGQEAVLADGYEMQMLVYGLALEQIIGQPPTELVLHFLRTGGEHIVTWSLTNREKAVAWVSERIELLRHGKS